MQLTNIKTCFKNINRCDQHPTTNKEKKLTPKDATFKCQSIDHNEETTAGLLLGIVMIEAVPCDGIPTCWRQGNETVAPDENFCDNELLTLWVPGKTFFNN